MNFLKGMLAIVAVIWVCAFAIVANEDAALSGKYDGADQFLSSILK